MTTYMYDNIKSDTNNVKGIESGRGIHKKRQHLEIRLCLPINGRVYH
jgi:hypothetical protein